MLQQVEYSPTKFLKWVVTVPDLRKLQKRGKLVKTSAAQMLLVAAYGLWFGGLFVVIAGTLVAENPLILIGLLLVPVTTVVGLAVVTAVLRSLVIDKQQAAEINQAQSKLLKLPAQRIAILGSYGKTTMKELLSTVLGQGKKVSATPGNQNVLISHARWVNKHVPSDSEILIFEYGEAAPGDISQLASFSQPQFAFVTGLAPAHLDGYDSVQAIAADLKTIEKHVKSDNLYINADVEGLGVISGHHYSQKGVDDLIVTDVVVSFTGMDFTLTQGGEQLRLHTGLIGEHQLGPLVAVVSLAKQMGLSDQQITDGVAATQPFEHRMQPRPLAGGWIIDDTYNGNIEGIRAGLRLLQKLPAKRKIYVTPGLVDQGEETTRVHEEMGRLIAEAAPALVVLMENSVTKHILAGLEAHKYAGEIRIESDPLSFYTNIEHFMAAGELVMMQNDWPDNYL